MRAANKALTKARQAANYRLSLMGLSAPAALKTRSFIELVAAQTGFELRDGEGPLDYLGRFNALSIKPIDNPRIAGPRYMPRPAQYKPKPHPRQAEIDAAPRQISVGGIGNGSENSPVWTR